MNDLLSERLWNNPRVSKTQLFTNIGIVSIADLMYENAEDISYKDCKMVYQIKTNFFEYHGVITCVKFYLGKIKEASKIHQNR